MSCFSRPNFSSVATLLHRSPPTLPTPYRMRQYQLHFSLQHWRATIAPLQFAQFRDEPQRLVHAAFALGCLHLSTETVNFALLQSLPELAQAVAGLLQTGPLITNIIGCG